ALAQRAWSLFQEIERAGGLRATIEQGLIAGWMEENRTRQEQAMAKRRRTQVGINQFANPNERVGEWSAELEAPRQAQAFEQIRYRLATQAKETPLVYLLLFGDTRMRNARSQFARNLFTAAGLSIQETSHQTDLAAALTEAKEVKPALLVFCAGDPDYADQLPELTPALKAALPDTRFILAGKPDSWADYGVEAPIFAGMNALEFLGDLVESLVAD
ncbi:MAG: methylmalonyl-CoA mutase family protein, partial [Bacteroidota bacterium]